MALNVFTLQDLKKIVLFSLIASSGFLPNLIYAQEAAGIQVSPAIIEDRADPGRTYDYSIKVTNGSDQQRVFYFSPTDISGLDDRGVPTFAEEGEKTPYEMSSWIELSESSAAFDPGESKTIAFKVHVPQDVSPGAHLGGVFVDALPPRMRESGAGIAMRVGTIVHFRVSGDVVEDARIRSFATDRLIYNEPSVKFEIGVENLGNVLVRPHGFVKIINMTGKEIANLRVNETGGAVFPEGDRIYNIDWEREEFSIGRYQALTSLVYGEDGRRTISASTSFWILPLKPILIAIGSLIGLVAFIFLIMRLYIRKKLREMGVSTQKRAGEYYVRRYNRSASRLMIIVIAVSLFSLVFLAALFLMFA